MFRPNRIALIISFPGGVDKVMKTDPEEMMLLMDRVQLMAMAILRFDPGAFTFRSNSVCANASAQSCAKCS